jgi:transposase
MDQLLWPISSNAWRRCSSATTSWSLPAHKVPGLKEVIEALGATVQYLRQYSPDLNPIEMPFSKFKAFLRKVSERTDNYFRHAGYASI